MEQPIPHHKYFDSQKEGEEVLLILRRHWVVYFPSVIVAAVVVMICILIYLNLDTIVVTRTSYFMNVLTKSGVSIFILFTILFVYISWLINYLNFNLVTNQHLVAIDQLMLFSRKISELTLEDIQDVSATQHGFFQSIFHYGDVIVQTAGEKPNFTLEKIGDPYEMSRQVMEIKDKYGEDTVKIVESEENSDKV